MQRDKTFFYFKFGKIQLKSDKTAQLLNKPYVNEVALARQYPPLKY